MMQSQKVISVSFILTGERQVRPILNAQHEKHETREIKYMNNT